MSTLKVNNVTDLGDDAIVTAGALVGAGKILQVVSVVKTDTFSTTSTSFVDITGFNVAITPTSASSKILVLVSASFGALNFASGTRITAKLLRDSTAIAGNASDDFFDSDVVVEPNANAPFPHSVSVLDTPATTSAITYKVQLKVSAATTGYLNRNRVTSASMSSSITVMEVAG